MLEQPADAEQASHRPPCPEYVEVDLAAVSVEELVKALLVSERQDSQVVQGVALAGLRPVQHATDFVIVNEDVVDLQVAVREDRRPFPKRSLGDASTGV